MTRTTKARRPATAAAKKAPAKPKRSAPVKKAPEPVELDTVAELTAADLVGSVEVAEPVAKKPGRKPKAVEEVIEAKPVVVEPVEEPVSVTVEEAIETPITVEAMVEAAKEVEQKGTEIMSDVMETTKKYAEEAKERFESAFAEISEKAKTGVEKSTKAFEELSDLAKGNVEAFVESGKIATKGVEAIGQDAAEYGRVSFEKASAAMKTFAAVKSPAEFFKLQSELLSSSFDAFAKETAKSSEAFLKLAGDVVQPISTRVAVVTEKVRSIAA